MTKYFKYFMGFFMMCLANAWSLATAAPVNMSLNAGWNLVGNGSTEPIGVYGSFGNSAVTTVWKWDVSSSKWAFFAPSQADGGAAYAKSKGYDFLTTIYPGEGFWVNASEPFTAVVDSGGVKSALSFQEGKAGALRQGWNLISVGDTTTPSAFNSNIGLAPPTAGTVAQNLTTLWAWDNTNARWYFYAPQIEANGGTALKDYANNKGYFDFNTQGKTLSNGIGFWVNYPSTSEMDEIEPVLKSFMIDISTCDANAKQHAATLFHGAYMDGQTVSDWITQFCAYGLGAIEAKGTRMAILAGDRAVVQTAFTNEKINADVTFGFQKVNGVWKFIADKVALPLDNPRVRHALTLNLNSGSSSKALFQYERYVDIWTDRSKYGNTTIPNSVEIYVLGANEAASKWSANNFPTMPDIVIYSAAANCSIAYALDASRKSCDFRATDTNYPNLFNKLESNPYSLAVYKFKDANGQCLNCDVLTGMPEGGGVMGNAKTFAHFFGSSVTAPQLLTSTGISPNSLPAEAKTSIKRYFALPTDSQVETLTNTLLSPTVANSFTVPLYKPSKFNLPLEGVWGGSVACGNNNPWVNASDVNLLPSDTSYTYVNNNPSSKTFSNAGYISLALGYRKDESEYIFYINASRGTVCTN
jgi:hypothetical protein